MNFKLLALMLATATVANSNAFPGSAQASTEAAESSSNAASEGVSYTLGGFVGASTFTMNDMQIANAGIDSVLPDNDDLFAPIAGTQTLAFNAVNTTVNYGGLFPSNGQSNFQGGVSIGAQCLEGNMYSKFGVRAIFKGNAKSFFVVPTSQTNFYTLTNATEDGSSDFAPVTASNTQRGEFESNFGLDVTVGGGYNSGNGFQAGVNVGYAMHSGKFSLPQLNDDDGFNLVKANSTSTFHGFVVALEGGLEISENLSLTASVSQRYFGKKTVDFDGNFSTLNYALAADTADTVEPLPSAELNNPSLETKLNETEFSVGIEVRT